MPPRDSIRSLMFRSTRVGMPSASTGAASISCRVRCRESRTSRTASGLGVPGILPFSTSTATLASSEYGVSEYTPGKSMSVRSSRPTPAMGPMRCSTVTPG